MTTDFLLGLPSNHPRFEQAFQQAFVRRAKACGNKVLLDLDITTAATLVSQIQLALRHPANTGRPAIIARALAEGLVAQLSQGEPIIAEVYRRGWDPAQDAKPGAQPAGSVAVPDDGHNYTLGVSIDFTGRTCPGCRGTGRDPMSDNVNWLPCTQCDGSGVIR